MSTAEQTARTARRRQEEPVLNGWGAFAAVILFLAGTFSFLYGLAAVLNDQVVTVGGGRGPIVWDFTAWGWIHMVIGVVMVAVAMGLIAVKGWARWAAIFFATLNALLQLGVITAFPIWALIVIALDVTIIYQLTANWDRTN
jgi:hypothetical protein